jgi:ketosteroid isomerase-like protein
MSHANEDLLRATYDAFSKGDMDGVLSNCADDIVFHVPGRSQMAGDYRGRDGFMAMVGKVMQLSGGTFREEVHDILANNEHGAVLTRHSLERGGRQFEYTTVHVWHVRDGKCTEFWEHPGDPAAFDEAWA